jgi:uncharacterized membrane protein
MERVQSEWRTVRYLAAILSAIAIAAAVRRLLLLAGPVIDGAANASVDATFRLKPELTRVHVMVGALAALAVPVQLSSQIRSRWPIFHRALGRGLVVASIATAMSGFAMLRHSIGGVVEATAIAVYGSALIVAVLTAWRSIRRGDIARHREWMIRAVAILLGVATTRPIVGAFFATGRITGLTADQFFGVAFWIGFSLTAVAGEWYVRATRHTSGPGRARVA